MTTPANPTPEPDGKMKPAPTTEYMVRWIRDDAEFERGEKLHGIAKFYTQIADRLEEQQTDLSDTRRRLAEVEKERDDAYDRGRSHELTEGNWLEVAKDRDEARNALERICVALRNPPIQADLPRVVHEIVKQRDDATVQLTALRNAADGMAGGLREALDVVHDQTDELLTGAEEALAAYAALISEGKS